MWRRILACFPCGRPCVRQRPGRMSRGWEYLIDKLVADGVSRERVLETLHDPRVSPFTAFEFSISPPREPRSLYRRLLRPATIVAARRCRRATPKPSRAPSARKAYRLAC